MLQLPARRLQLAEVRLQSFSFGLQRLALSGQFFLEFLGVNTMGCLAVVLGVELGALGLKGLPLRIERRLRRLDLVRLRPPLLGFGFQRLSALIELGLESLELLAFVLDALPFRGDGAPRART